MCSASFALIQLNNVDVNVNNVIQSNNVNSAASKTLNKLLYG